MFINFIVRVFMFFVIYNLRMQIKSAVRLSLVFVFVLCAVTITGQSVLSQVDERSRQNQTGLAIHNIEISRNAEDINDLTITINKYIDLRESLRTERDNQLIGNLIAVIGAIFVAGLVNYFAVQRTFKHFKNSSS